MPYPIAGLCLATHNRGNEIETKPAVRLASFVILGRPRRKLVRLRWTTIRFGIQANEGKREAIGSRNWYLNVSRKIKFNSWISQIEETWVFIAREFEFESWEILSHPTCSPNIATSDYRQFQTLQRNFLIGGKSSKDTHRKIF